MAIFDTMNISASGLSSQRRKLNAIASNIANADTTRTDEGGPYKRKRIIMMEAPQPSRFSTLLQEQKEKLTLTNPGHIAGTEARTFAELLGSGVETQEVREEPVEPRMVYDPAHPDAREDGYVLYPDINIVTEMVDMIAASRAYEANVTTLDTSKSMFNRALEI